MSQDKHRKLSEAIEKFEFTIAFEKSSGDKKCSLAISTATTGSTNNWMIDDDDLDRMVTFIDLMSTKYCKLGG